MKRFDNNRHAASCGDSLSRMSEPIKNDDTVTVCSTPGLLTTRNSECKQRNLLDIFMRPWEFEQEIFLDVTVKEEIFNYMVE